MIYPREFTVLPLLTVNFLTTRNVCHYQHQSVLGFDSPTQDFISFQSVSHGFTYSQSNRFSVMSLDNHN